MKNRRALTLALTTITAAVAVTLAAFTTPMQPVAADTARPDVVQVKALYSEKCSACHNLPSPEEKGYSRAEWQKTVNTMLNKYHASDSIAPAEAAQIVDYLATFAPKGGANRIGRQPLDPWATDTNDVWTDAPAASRVFNFESGSLAGLSPVGSGTPGPAPVWQVATDKPGADGSVARVSAPAFRADRFALLLDKTDQGRNLDVRVRFRIESGKASPAVGIVFGYADPSRYTVLRCNQTLGDLALIQIAGPNHTTVQQTPLVLLPAAAVLPPTPPAPKPGIAGGPTPPLPPAPIAAAPPPTPLAPGWHTLRLLVKDGQVRGWLDMNKRINTTLPNYAGGKVGLWTQGNTVASFHDWTVDWYDGAGAAPLS